MQLLVSVRSASETRAALEGGAQIIDAKEPAAGALGPVSPGVLAEIRDAVPEEVPLSAALGDVTSEADVARSLGGVGVELAFVKLGFLGVRDSEVCERLLGYAVKLAAGLSGRPRVVAVGYADWERADSLNPVLFPLIIRRAGGDGLLIDTADKSSGRLFDFLSTNVLAEIGHSLRSQGALYAVAGSLDSGDVAGIRDTDADIVGVRGAVTGGGRTGNVDPAKVARLAALIRSINRPTPLEAAGLAARSHQ